MSDELAQDDDGTFTMGDIGAPDDSDDEEEAIGKKPSQQPPLPLVAQLTNAGGSAANQQQPSQTTQQSGRRPLPRESLDGETIFAVGEDGDRFSDDSDEENQKLVKGNK
jgi:hypothetical protein